MSAAPGSTGAAQEFSGKSVEEATAEGLLRLGLRPEDAEIEVEVEEPLVTEVDPDAPVDVVAWLVDV